MTTTPATGVERGALMFAARNKRDPEAKAALADLVRSRRKTSDAVDTAQRDRSALDGA